MSKKKKTSEDGEEKFFGPWRQGIKELAPDHRTLIMRGKLRIKTRPTDLEAMELIERYKGKTFDEVEKILDDAKFWLHMIRMLSFEDAEKKIEEGKVEGVVLTKKNK